ncbi:MAG TPA: type II toxin-antitoxin system VapC family toxin [Bryobacteraceae bacterium]|jgi:predicted nucleic acid-binding protein
MYLDSAYIAKYYLNEPDCEPVRRLIHDADSLVSSEWSIIEVGCAFHRHFRQGGLTSAQYKDLLRALRKHMDEGLWTLVPLDRRLVRRVNAAMDTLPPDLILRSGDVLQLVCAQDSGEREVWTSDRHVLAAAHHFGLTARSVGRL